MHDIVIDRYESLCDMVNTRLHNDSPVDKRADMYFLRQSVCERYLAVYWTSVPREWATITTPIEFLDPVTRIITWIDLEQPEVDITKFLFQHLWDNGNGDSLLEHELQIVDTRPVEIAIPF
tara:strand:- start:107 stop:469 length:363 start_codon:yes stop_codon:yes gene_type:complete